MEEFDKDFESEDGYDFFDQEQRISQIKSFLRTFSQELIQKVGEEIIGSNEINTSRPDAYSNEGDEKRRIRNELRAEQRSHLKEMRKI